MSCESLSCHFRNISTKFGKIQALAPVSGDVECGEVLAIMGPSGAGKSTLLNSICRRAPVTQGEMWYADKDRKLSWSKSLKKLIAFVEQEDIALPNLSVRETLLFSARLRLPKASLEEKNRVVNETIELLKLGGVSDSKVGGGLVRGISGGEKKRLMIGVELLTKPLFLALDEPTSGLDSAVAATIVSSLHDLAVTRNVSVVASLHQPSSRIFLGCDKLILLDSEGIVYRGSTEDANGFLDSLYLSCPPSFSVSDWLLEVIVNGELSTKDSVSKSIESDVENPDDSDIRKERRQSLIDRYGPNSLPKLGKSEKLENIQGIRNYNASYLEQIRVLFSRIWKEVKPNVLNKNNVIQHVGNAILAGTMWWQLSYRERDIWPRITLSFAIPIAWLFFPLLDSLKIVPSNEIMLKKELSSNTYKLSAWYLTTTTTLLLPMIVQSFLYVSISFILSNLGPPVVWAAMYGVVFLSLVCFQSIGLFFSAAIPARNLYTSAILYMTFCFLFTGIFVPLDSTPIPELAFVNPMMYVVALSLQAVFVLNGRKYRCGNEGSLYPKSCDDSGDGKIAHIEILREYELLRFTPQICIGTLLGIIAFTRFTTFYILKRRMKKHLAAMSKYE